MKQRCLSLFLAVACVLSLFSFGVVRPVEVQAGSGIPDILFYEENSGASAFQISTAEGLQKFSQLGQSYNFAGKTLYMICDINMSGFSYTPPVDFAGTFDGGFHAITQLTVSTSEANCGFVGKLSAGGVLRNLGIEGSVFTATCSKDSWRAGSLVGIMDRSTVENCWSSASVTISGGYDYLAIGGIAGGMHNGGVIKNCYFAGIATGIKVAAGICGWGQGHYEGFVGQIYNCYNMGQLVASETKFPIGRYSGKILEANKPNAMFNNFYFDSSYAGYDWSDGDTLVSRYHLGDGHLAYVLDRDSALGGAPVWSQGALFPELRKTAGVYPLTVTYNAKGKTSTATLYFNAGDTYTIGVPDSVSVSLSANAGTVSGRSFLMPAKAASLTVTVDAANIADYSSFPNESIYVVTNQAGFAAMATAVNGGTTFSGKSFYMLGNINMNSVSHTPIGQFVSNTSWTKSFSGKFYGNNFKVLNLKVNNTSLNGGGLFGSCYKAYFKGLHIFNGSVTVANRAGGITGYSDGCTFEYCSNGAAIKSTSGSDGIGGIAGVARISSVFNYCCNFGTVTATASGAAGVAGWGQGNIQMTGCFNVGKVTATSDVAALARVKADYVPEFKDCYYLATSCSTTVAGTSASLQRFQCGIVGSYINTSYRSTTSNGVYTNTPALPAICGENQQPAICTRLYAYEDGLSLGYQTICANLGDEIPYTNQLNYYSTEAYSAPDALTSYAYPIGVPFSISYVTNGGSWTGTGASSYTRRIGVGLPDETKISKNGYCFAGWFENSACTGQPLAVVTPGSTGKKTVYAKWASPVVISTVAEYLSFANTVNGGNSYSDKYVTIAADLDFGGQTIPAIGTESAPFCGVLDGGGHILKNFSIQGNDAQGIVGYLKEGTVKFLRVESATVSGKTNTGSVVGVNDEGLVLGCLSSAEVKSTWTTFDYSLMSQNVRYGNDASPNSTSERVPRMKTFLKNYAPDIIGFQEFDAPWKTVVESVLTDYGKQCVFGNTSAQNAGSPLYWNSNKFVALEKGTFWLSETPGVMSLGWGATSYRTCSFAVLQVKNQDMIVIAANTHLDHRVDAARINGIKLIMERMTALMDKYEAKGYKEIYFHITGDFNMTPSHSVIKDLSTTLTEARYAAVSLGTPVNQNTFSAYNPTPTSLIDYMFVSNNVDVKTYKVALDKVDGNAISDHYGLHGTLRIGGNSHGGIAGENRGVILSCGYTGTITTKGGSAGIAAENKGNILNSYGQYSSTATGVFANGITTKYNQGQVNFSIYDPNCGMAGAGTAVTNLKAANVPGKLNRLLSLWVRNDAVNNGLPFICRAHSFVYKDKGNGTHSGSCSYCGVATTENHTAVTDKAVAPTCTAAGKTEGSHCSLCKAVIVAQQTVPAKGHSYTSTVTTEATCTAAGVRTYTCGACSHSYTEAIPATNHSYSSKVTKEATCTAAGVKTFTCSNCSHSYTESIPAKGHTEVTVPGYGATCLESGMTDGVSCSVCQAVIKAQELTPRLGHDYKYTDNGDGTHKVTCSRCSKVVSGQAHSMVDGSCSLCGAVDSTPVVDEAVVIRHSLNLASDISINYAVAVSQLADYDSFYLSCLIPVYEGNTYKGSSTVIIQPELKGSYYYFTLNGLTAVQIGDSIEATLNMQKDSRSYLSKADSYSVATYAYAQLNKTDVEAPLKSLCAQLLRYGAKAQIFKGYRTNALADASLTTAQAAYLSDLNAVSFGNNNKDLNDLSSPAITWVGKSLDLNSKVTLKYVFNASGYEGKIADLTLHVSYQDVNGNTVQHTLSGAKNYNPALGWYTFDLDSLLASELRSVISGAVYSGDTQLSTTMVYSADTYANNKEGNLLALCKALFAYSDSAKTFFAK